MTHQSHCPFITNSPLHDASSPSISPSLTPPTNTIHEVVIKKPLGITLAENASLNHVFIEEINPNGNAAATGQVQVGDIIAATSAIVLKSNADSDNYGKEGHGQRLYDNWETIMFECEGQSFDTVMAAVGSNNERWGINKITLRLLRPSIVS